MAAIQDTSPEILAQTGARDDGLAIGIGASVVLVAVVIVHSWLRARSRAAVAPQSPRIGSGVDEKDAHAMGARDERLFAQHTALNDLTADKLRLEAQYLQLQTNIARKELDARDRMGKYHDLMTQKAQLEIQSLRLHIREQRKRLDDFTSSDDD